MYYKMGEMAHPVNALYFEAFLTVLRIPFSSACQVTSLYISLDPRLLMVARESRTHLTDLDTVRLCFLISELSLRSSDGLNSRAEPPLELEELFSITIEIDVKPGSVFCRSRSGLGDLTINFGVGFGEIRRNNSGIRPLDSSDDGSGGGAIDLPEVVDGIELLVDDPSGAVDGGLFVDDPSGSR